MSEEKTISRRGLVLGTGGCVALLGIGGGIKLLAGDTALLRPPGGQDEAAFIGACIRCDRCRSACPQGAIGVADLEDGLLNARTPKMAFKLGACNFCEDTGTPKCVLACPTEALRPGFDSSKDKIGLAVVDTDECVLYRTGAHLCSRQCVDACEYDALTTDEKGFLVIDESKCNGCGQCEYACPSASYASYTGSGRRGINIEIA